MTRAEEAALKAYPEQDMLRTPNTHKSQLNKERRRIYRQGYYQAEKDMKERFIQFVHSHYPINYTGWIQDFQRAMEDKK